MQDGEPPLSSEDSEVEQRVKQLLDRQSESRSLDYKTSILFGPHRKDKGEVLKWIMAFANTRDGGDILIGVTEDSGKFVPVGVSVDQARSFDPSDIGNFARNYCSVLPHVTTHTVTIDGKDLVLLHIDEFGDEPIVCTKDLHGENNQLILRAGSIYVRTDDAKCSVIDSGESMRNFLDLAVQKRGDSLLHQIRRMVGAPAPVQTPQQVIGAYEPELTAAYSLFETASITEPYWFMEIGPTERDVERIESMGELRSIRRESVVSVRGWDFPHVDHESDVVFEDGLQSVTNWDRYHEAHRFYRSGLFTWRRRLAEDSTENYQGALSYESTIYTLAEFLIFANRYAPKILEEGEIFIRFGVVGIEGRTVESGAGVMVHSAATGARQFQRTYTLSVEALRASHLEIANKAARQLFELFDVNVSEGVIGDWQQRFIERRFF